MKGFRYVIMFLSMWCLTFMFSNSLALNFTVICMEDVVESQTTNTTRDDHWLHSSSMINYLFSAPAIGCLIGTLPSTIFIHKIGVRWTMTVYGLISALSTFFFPLAVKLGFSAVFIMRVLQGIGTALAYPLTGLISSQWSPLSNIGVYLSVISCHAQFSPTFTMPVAGFLCESSFGWSSLYYLQGIVSLVIFLAFAYFYRDIPNTQSLVDPEELKMIQQGKDGEHEKQNVPYGEMCRDPCMIAFVLGTIGINLSFQTLLQYGPTYMNKVLNLDVRSTGFATALPFILSAISKFSTGFISDKVTFVSDRTRMIFFAVLSQGGMSIMLIVIAMATNALLAQIAFTAAIIFSGINVVGHIKCAQKVARQHVHFVMAIVSFLLCVITLFIPVAVSIVCPDNTSEQWSRLFVAIAIIVVIVNIPFVFWARSEPASWTANPRNKIVPLEA